MYQTRHIVDPRTRVQRLQARAWDEMEDKMLRYLSCQTCSLPAQPGNCGKMRNCFNFADLEDSRDETLTVVLSDSLLKCPCSAFREEETQKMLTLEEQL